MGIGVPFLNRQRDCVAFYAKELPDGKVHLTDGGETFGYLKFDGIDIKTELFKRYLERILGRFNLKLDGDELSIMTTQENFPSAMNEMIQGILALGEFYVFDALRADLFESAQLHTESPGSPA